MPLMSVVEIMRVTFPKVVSYTHLMNAIALIASQTWHDHPVDLLLSLLAQSLTGLLLGCLLYTSLFAWSPFTLSAIHLANVPLVTFLSLLKHYAFTLLYLSLIHI